MVNLFPREVPRVVNLFPRELIESTPKDFPNANPKLHQRPLGTNLELEGLPEGTDSTHYTRGFSKLVPELLSMCLVLIQAILERLSW